MNPIRKFILKLVNGVAREEVIPRSMFELSIPKQERPIVTLRIKKRIPSNYPEFCPPEEIVSYTKKEMAHALAEELQEKKLIRYEHSHTHDYHEIEAEIRAVELE